MKRKADNISVNNPAHSRKCAGSRAIIKLAMLLSECSTVVREKKAHLSKESNGLQNYRDHSLPVECRRAPKPTKLHVSEITHRTYQCSINYNMTFTSGTWGLIITWGSFNMGGSSSSTFSPANSKLALFY